MPEWGIALIGVAGVVVGVVITEIRQWVDKKQRFQTMTFEKRLAVHQEAYSYCIRIKWLAQGEIDIENGSLEKLYNLTNEALEWAVRNCLYIDEISRQLTIEALDSVLFDIEKYPVIKDDRTVSNESFAGNIDISEETEELLNKALDSLCEGVGAKYLPTTVKRPGKL